MKKILLTTFALAAGTLLGSAQGTISIGNASTATYLIETNAAQYQNGTSITLTGSASGRTASLANSFFYEVLTTTAGANASGGVPSPTPASLDPFNAIWLDTGVGGKNTTLTRGGITGVGGPAAANWGAPTGATYDTGSDQWFLIVGWSANLGATWANVKNNFATTEGFFGQSALGYQVAGGGPNSLSTVVLWGNQSGIAGAGMASGFSLGVHSVPEPGTFAIAGLGVAAMLISRRRK